MPVKLPAILLLSLLPALSGCIAVVAGAAAGGATGYYVEKDDRSSSSQTSADDAISAEVRSRLAQMPEVSGLSLQVDTSDKVVSVSGDVPNATVADHVIAAARSVDGVKSVRSELTVH